MIKVLPAAIAAATAGSVITVDYYGADNTGVTVSDTACTLMLAAKGYLEFTPGKKYLLNQISVTDGNLIVFGNGAEIKQNSDNAVFKQYITYTNAQAISAIAATSIDMGSGTTTATSRITIPTPSAYSADDVVRVISDDLGDWADPTNLEHIGEPAELFSTDATYLYTKSALIQTYTTSPRIWKMNKQYKCLIKDVNFTAVSGAATTFNQPIIWVSGVYKPQILDCTTDYSYSEFTRLDGCYKAQTRVSVSNLQTNAALYRYGYGVVEYSCAFGTHEIQASNVRHAYTTGVKGTTAGDNTPELFGRTIFPTIQNSIGFNCQSAPFSTHADAYCATFSNCHAVMGYKGPSGGQQGFGLRGIGNRVIGSSCYGGTAGVSITPDYTSVTTNTNKFEIINFTYRAHARSIGTNTAINVNGVAATTGLQGHIKNLRVFGAASSVTHIDINYADVVIEDSMHDAPLTGTATGRILEMDNTSTVLWKRPYIDFTGATGTDLTLANLLNSNCTLTIEDGYVKVNGADWDAIANLNSSVPAATNAKVYCYRLNCDTAPTTASGIRTGSAGASAVTDIDYVVNYGRTSDYNYFTDTYGSSGNKTADFGTATGKFITYDVTVTASGAILNTLPSGKIKGQRLRIKNNASSSYFFIINHNTAGKINTLKKRVLRIGEAVDLDWDGTYWTSLMGGGYPSTFNILDGATYTRNSNNSTDTTQSSLVSYTIPGGLLSANGSIRITVLWEATNSATGKTLYVVYAGTTNYLEYTGIASNTSARTQTEICANNSTSAQKGFSKTTTGFGASSAIITSTADTTADQTISLECKWASNIAAESIKIHHVTIEVLNS